MKDDRKRAKRDRKEYKGAESKRNVTRLATGQKKERREREFS